MSLLAIETSKLKPNLKNSKLIVVEAGMYSRISRVENSNCRKVNSPQLIGLTN